ncbi:Tyrosine-protein phosphatase YwqE [Roseimaritima multifibrata]|uniref:protein-tyrosine-phosphatase n=1 Tax=Roseimaritima multifibrata TaxID=1930274 RepID=A0A517MP31_9BACT|nr:CpsB/CapC family capsule biosynthesis tyrosine phosphatase [Roseimaritima multifibrata]QDS96645.1 Tyrosine-protein phosphatase YwqE [Roseimaritima multifibrata]
MSTVAFSNVPSFVDIHCHLLPGIDDGSRSWEDSLAMAQQMVAEGIDTVCVTPHQLGNYTSTTGQTIRQRTGQLQQWLQTNQVPLNVLPGADVRIDADMITRLQSGDCVSLGDRRRHVLLELPHELYLPLEPVLEQLERIGMVGILSHPERNRGIMRQPQVIEPLIRAGCLMQVTADSFVGEFGQEPEALAKHIVGNGWCHFLATDAHGSTKRPPRLRRAYDLAEQMVGRSMANAMCSENPRAVAEGRNVDALPPVVNNTNWMQRTTSWLFGRKSA